MRQDKNELSSSNISVSNCSFNSFSRTVIYKYRSHAEFFFQWNVLRNVPGSLRRLELSTVTKRVREWYCLILLEPKCSKAPKTAYPRVVWLRQQKRIFSHMFTKRLPIRSCLDQKEEVSSFWCFFLPWKVTLTTQFQSVRWLTWLIQKFHYCPTALLQYIRSGCFLLTLMVVEEKLQGYSQLKSFGGRP